LYNSCNKSGVKAFKGGFVKAINAGKIFGVAAKTYGFNWTK
jgi:hypothetical protein